MAYPICVYTRKATDSEFQVRDSDLSHIRTWSLSASTGYTLYPFSIDSKGSIFFGRDTIDYVYQYDEDGNYIDRATTGSQRVFGTDINAYGYVQNIQLVSDGHDYDSKGFTRNSEMENAFYSSIRFEQEDTSYSRYIAMDSSNASICYVINSGVIEKWQHYSTLLATKSPDYGYSNILCLGDYLYGGENGSYFGLPSAPGLIWKTNKNLAGGSSVVTTMTPDAITGGTGAGEYLVTDKLYLGRLSTTTFVAGFRASTWEWDSGLEAWVSVKAWHAYLRVYNTSGTQIGSTVDLGANVLEAIPGHYYDTGEVLPSVTTQDVTVTGGGSTSVTYNGTLTNGDGKCFREGFEFYDVLTPGTVRNVYNNIAYYDNGAYTKGPSSSYMVLGHTYKARAKVQNAVGYGYGDWVEFTLSVEPVVTTQAASEIDNDCAMGNGTIVSGSNITERGFEIKLNFGEFKDSSSGTLANYIDHIIAGFVGDVTWDIVYKWNGELIKTESEIGEYAVGAYEIVLGYLSVLGNPSAVFSDKLFRCETYTYRAYATNDVGTGYGDWVEFSTLCTKGSKSDDQIPLTPFIPPSGLDFPEDEVPITIDDILLDYPPFDYPPFEPLPPFGYPVFELIPPWDYEGVDFPDYVNIPFVDYSEFPMPEPWEPVFPEPIPVPNVPDYVPPDFPGRFGNFYYRKAYTKKQIDDLRQKCIDYTETNIEYCLVVRHNIHALRQFFNMMSDNIADQDEFNAFEDVLPTQHLDELYHKKLELDDFKGIINDFISNSINNIIATNANFALMNEGLVDYIEGDNVGFVDLSSNRIAIHDEDPDVEMLKSEVDKLRLEAGKNFTKISTNLNVVKSIIT